MGTYEDYPFHSAKGQRIMLDIFNGIYKSDENDATQIHGRPLGKWYLSL